MPARGGHAAQQPRRGQVAQGRVGMRGDVLLGHVADDPRVHAEEFADVVQRLRGSTEQRAVAEDENLLGRKP